MSESAITPAPPTPLAASGLVRPVAEAAEILAAWRQFQDLKARLLTADDYQPIGDKQEIKRSGWAKIAAAFGISTQLVAEARRERDDGSFVWEITMRALAPNGRYAEGVGACGSRERPFVHPDHDVRATAATRATKRAISDLVGGSGDEDDHPPAPQARPAAPLATDKQLASLRAHLRRSGRSEHELCADAGVSALEDLSRGEASRLIGELAALPNA